MMMRLMRRLAKDRRGAVAPTVALSLIGLLASGGIAFDYARLATMDSELQQAADQAALAGASQLDGQSGAVSRAVAAAQGLLVNQTLLGNDSGGITIQTGTTTGSVFRVYFYTSKANAEADSSPILASAAVDSTAKFIKVAVVGRQAKYALTPIVGAISSSTIGAEAVAGLGSAICKEPPVMMCNPATDPSQFDVTTFIGKGFNLIAKGAGGSYAAGNFGFLDVGAGANDLSKLIAYGTLGFKCVDVATPTTEPGSLASVINDFNTRFDIFESGDNINCYSQGLCPPSLNSRKDVVYKNGSTPSKNNCGIAVSNGSKGWTVSNSPYRPTTAAALPTTTTPDAMGYPRDFCHSISKTGSCTGSVDGRIGTGAWDIDAYWRVNHPIGTTNGAVAGLYPTSLNSTIVSASGIAMPTGRTYPTRYMVYRWEMANVAVQLPAAGRSVSGVGTDYGQPLCKAGLTGSTPTSTYPDRRIIPIAVVNCTGLNGKKPVNPIDFVDGFLVEPSVSRSTTDFGDVYVEIVQHTGNGTGGTAPQVVRRDKPYLIK
jgi:Flp pilus assembly protein TadG